MESKSIMQLKKETKSKSNSKNKRERVQELQLVEFTDLIQCNEEKDSSNS